jgi:DNA-binding transcriptional LysR family regulator
VRSIGAGDSGKVLLGVTPPALVGLVPSLVEQFTGQFPDAQVEARPMWRPNLIQGLHAGEIDVAIVLGSAGEEDGLTGRSLAAQPLVAGVRPDHPRAALDAAKFTDLADEVLGIASDDLFPAWARCQRQALSAAGIAPPTVTLSGPDMESARWADDYPGVDWILLLPSLAAAHERTVTVPVQPYFPVPFTLLWRDDGTAAPIADRFIAAALAADLPPDWSLSSV